MYWSFAGPVPAVDSVWMGDSVIDPAIGHRSDPVLGTDLVFTFANGACTVGLQGPVTKRTVYPHRPGFEYVGVRFVPGLGSLVPGHLLGDLCDQRVDVRDLLGIDLHRTADQMVEAADLASRARYVCDVVESATVGRVPSALVASALREFDASPADARVGTVAAALGVTERQLQREFLATVGLGPKKVARISRAMRAHQALGRPGGGDLARVAAELGYYDQAHMTNDVKRVLATTPGAIVTEALRQSAAPTPSK